MAEQIKIQTFNWGPCVTKFKIKPEYGINNASFSLMLLGNNDGTFKPQKSKKSGLFIKGEIRDIIKIGGKNIDNYIFALNNDSMKIYNK